MHSGRSNNHTQYTSQFTLETPYPWGDPTTYWLLLIVIKIGYNNTYNIIGYWIKHIGFESI